LAIPIAAGETIDFVQGAGAGIGSENSPFDVTITEISPPSEPVECVLLLDAGTGLKDPNGGTDYGDGDVVKRWQDTQSGNNMEALLAWGNPTLETNEINGQNVIRFTGDDGLVVDPNSDPDDLLNAPNFSIYVVGRINDLALSQVFYSNYSDPAAGAGIGISDTRFNTPDFSTAMNGAVTPLTADQELVKGRYYLITLTKDWLSEKKIYINGQLSATGSGKVMYNTDTVVAIGALDIGRLFLNGDIAEIRVYNGVDPDETVTDELMTKYDIDTSPVLSDPNIISLTGMTLYQTSSTGASLTTWQFNTMYPDPAWDLSIYERDTILTDPNELINVVLNHHTYMMIDIPFQLGQERTFTWHNAHTEAGPEPGSYFGISLFFDDGQNRNAPGIAVFAQMDSTGPGDGNPDHSAISSGAGGWPYSASVPGPGWIYYDLERKLKITLTKFVVYDSDLGIDIVPTQNAGEHPLDGPDGFKDMFGQFTLKVETLDCSVLDHFAGDIDGNCRVNLEDIVLLLADWLKCNDPENTGCAETH